MLQIKDIVNNGEDIINALKKRNVDYTIQIDRCIELHEKRKLLTLTVEKYRHKAKAIIGRNDIAITLKENIKNTEIERNKIEEELYKILVTIPNTPHETVPAGKCYEDNVEIFNNNLEIDTIPDALPHWEFATKNNIIDFEAGTKLAGTGFPVYINKGARLQRALINFCLDEANKFGFIEHQVPILANQETVFATGQYPDKEGQMYHIEKDNLYLVPTAEVPLTNLYRNKTIDIDKLPIMITGYTPCFRREAGGYGADTKGLNRLHQFDKVELVCITTQEDGMERLEIMRNYIQGFLDKLKIKYRVIELCGYELVMGAQKAYDIEAFCPVQNKWLEIVTVGNFGTFQANRMNCKYGKEKKLVNTLNGTGIALPRIMATILETYQRDGFLEIPEVLIEYTGFNKI